MLSFIRAFKSWLLHSWQIQFSSSSCSYLAQLVFDKLKENYSLLSKVWVGTCPAQRGSGNYTALVSRRRKKYFPYFNFANLIHFYPSRETFYQGSFGGWVYALLMRVWIIVLQMLWSSSALILIAILRLPPGSWYPVSPWAWSAQLQRGWWKYQIFDILSSLSLVQLLLALLYLLYSCPLVIFPQHHHFKFEKQPWHINSMFCRDTWNTIWDKRENQCRHTAHVSAGPLGHSNKHSGDATDKARDDWNEWDKEAARAGSWAFILLITNLFRVLVRAVSPNYHLVMLKS